MGPEYCQMLDVPFGVCTYCGKKEASLESLTFVG
jgi:hypothetical protein